MHDLVQIFQKARMLSSDPGSSGYVSSSRCLGTRRPSHRRTWRNDDDQRNFFMDGALFVQRSTERLGGAGRDRTDDLKLAKLPLSQLSYGPILCLWPAGPRRSARRAFALAALRAGRKSQQGWLSRPKASQGRTAAANFSANSRAAHEP